MDERAINTMVNKFAELSRTINRQSSQIQELQRRITNLEKSNNFESESEDNDNS